MIMPAIGMAMTEASLVAWLKQPGDTVVAGEAVAEIETDKTTMDLESPADGILGPHLVAEGEIAAVGTVIAHILDEAGDSAEVVDAPAAELQTPFPAPTVLAAAAEPAPEVRERHELSPRARRLAREEASRATAAEQAVETRERGDELRPPPSPGRHRALIAAKVSQSWHEIPHFAVTREIRADTMLSVRAAVKVLHPTVTLTDLLLRALAISFLRTGARSPLNLGLAVATPAGVAIPILGDVAGMTLPELADLRAAAVQRAINGALTPEDTSTVADSTLSNLGDYNIDSFTGVIYPDQTSLLTVGRARPRVIVEDGSPVVRTTFFATLNVDHRIYDGADAARLLAAFSDVIGDEQSLFAGGDSNG
ncbi:MAG: dihydrolipoamide acetyltransferase family protein [Candidatus Limnocylindrales bacterium]